MTGDYPRQWAKWLPLAEWWYNTTYHSVTKTTPYFAVYGQEPPDHTFCISKPSSVAEVGNWVRERAAIIKHLKEHLSQAQHRMKHYADKGRSEREFTVGDWVFLRLQPYKQVTVALHKNMKLAPRFYGPYQVLERVGTVGYRLNLPAAAKIHPVFHVSLLKKKLGANVVAQTTLPPIGPEGAFQLEPMALLERRMVKRGNKAVVQWLVQWMNSFPEDATWADHSEIEAKEIVEKLVRSEWREISETELHRKIDNVAGNSMKTAITGKPTIVTPTPTKTSSSRAIKDENRHHRKTQICVTPTPKMRATNAVRPNRNSPRNELV
ncbi:hypothetical protein RHSIM_RhsimUnG0227300 [Rhododendron simsii]|uniref:Tf2-1-like SH3-like domain-containing protein n=1 Tax=Rhododendron simsii TaxID=118357 RepID=A0A834L3T0_RHOSS|nr:hypothetical protein RHSIM_RhsimUnG0227300 [Rhododendron simsii]